MVIDKEYYEIKNRIHQHLINKTDFLKVKDRLSEDQLRVFVDKAITELCHEQHIHLSTEVRINLIREMVSAVVSLGPLRPLMEDPTITEIMINGASSIYIQRRGHIELTDIKFGNNHQLQHTIQKLLAASGSSRRVDESSPYVDFSLADGSRVNVILPPCSLAGPVVTIRKFASDIGNLDDLLKKKMLNDDMATLLVASVQAKMNIVFCGATGTGKTTALNILSHHIPKDERIISIEDTAELRLLQDHVVPLQSKTANIEGRGAISIRELFVNSLRMRPDRIIIGEVRGEEMLDLIQSISSGHTGSLAIIHADSPEDCYYRMVTMMLMTGIQLSVQEIQKQVARAIDLVVHIELFQDGVRRITNVTDIYHDQQKDKVVLEDIFRFEEHSRKESGEIVGDWTMNKKSPSFMDKFTKRAVRLPDGFFNKP